MTALHFLPYLPALGGLAARSSGDLLKLKQHRPPYFQEQRLVDVQPIMSLDNRLELENEILELELRLKNARSRLREVHENPAGEDSIIDLDFTDSMLSLHIRISQSELCE
jgi:hypothetical protein